MSLEDDILDVRRLRLHGDFESQVHYLLGNIRLKRVEVEELSNLFTDLERSLRVDWPGCQVYPFGSIVTGLGIKTSDVDCYVSLPSWERTHPGQVVMRAKQILSRRYAIFSELFAIPMAKVPIVKFYHIPTGRHCDLNFKSPSGVQNSRLLGYLLHMDDRALPLAILVKYWSKIHNLTGTNLMPNYSLTLLVIFYLQQINILPPVFVMQIAEQPHIVDNWDTQFGELDYTTSNESSLFELLGGFFEYYRDFDYAGYVISPYMGCPIDKKLWNNAQDLPEEFELYKQNLRKKVCQPLKVVSSMCVQDPFEHCRNCTLAVHPKLALKLLAHFRAAALLFNENNKHIFLREILTKAPVGAQNIGTKKKRGKVMKLKDMYKKIKRKDIHNIRQAMGEYSNSRVNWR